MKTTTETPSPELSPYQMRAKFAAKKLAASKAMGWVQKNGVNTYSEYRYATASDTFAACRGPIADAGLCFGSTMLSYAVTIPREGGKNFRTEVRMEYTLTDAETGYEEEYTAFGYADDTGDKGIFKAQTGALKYWLDQNFMLPTGDDPEADNEAEKNNKQEASGKPQNRPTGKPQNRPTGKPQPQATQRPTTQQAAKPAAPAAKMNAAASSAAADEALKAAEEIKDVLGAAPAPKPAPAAKPMEYPMPENLTETQVKNLGILFAEYQGKLELVAPGRKLDIGKLAYVIQTKCPQIPKSAAGVSQVRVMVKLEDLL